MIDTANTEAPPTHRPSTLISWAQRVVLLNILERESSRLHQQADELDEGLSRDADAYDVLDDMPGYDQRSGAIDRMRSEAYAVDDVVSVLEDAKVLTTRPVLDRDPVGAL